jgi:2-methylcitrate dehydratase PrpD
MTISEKLIDKYSKIHYEDFNSKTLEAGRNLLIDAVGNLIASIRIADNEKLNQTFAKNLLENSNATPLYIGMLIHSLDFDDTHYDALIHTGSITVPSALYASFNKKINGKDFLTSLILGVDLAVKIASIEKHAFHKKGFHATSIVGVFSSAFIYAYLNKYSKESMVDSLGVAGSFSSGNLAFLTNGDNTKIVHPGWASLGGCSAAELVKLGITGSKSIFEDKNGIYNLYSDISIKDKHFDLSKETWDINDVSFKPYPICQLSISTLRLASEIIGDLEVSQIEKIIISLPKDSYDIVAKDKLIKSQPRTPYEAKFSIYWSLAALIVKKKLTVDSFEKQGLLNEEIHNLAKKIDVKTFEHTQTAASIPGELEVYFKDGNTKTYFEEKSSNLISNSELIINKFLQNSSMTSDDRYVKSLLEIEETDDVGKIVGEILNEQLKKY